MSTGSIVGSLLLLWIVADLFIGKVYLHRVFVRSEEPAGYWLTSALWLAVAISCFIWW